LIYVPPPDQEVRLKIFELYIKDMPLASDVDLENLAKVTKGYSGADIEAICREAGMYALRRDAEKTKVTGEDFKKATEKIRPSITPDIENWYQNVVSSFKKIEKPTTSAVA